MSDRPIPEARAAGEPAPLSDEQFLTALRRVRRRHRLASVAGFVLGAILIGLAVEFPSALTPMVLGGIVLFVLGSIGWRYASYVLVPRDEEDLESVDSVSATVVAVRSIPPVFVADRDGHGFDVARSEIRLVLTRTDRTVTVVDFVRPSLRVRLVPGAEVRVRVDPLEPRDSALVWSSLSSPRKL